MAAERIILRVALEAASPLAIASGEEDALNDTMLARDPNRLPTIPATSLAGALRAAILGAAGKKQTDEWFGFQERDEGGRSAVTFTDGLFHWQDNHPRDGLMLGTDAPENDKLAKLFLPDNPVLTRDHVRLNDKGVVDGEGKFTRAAVPTGARFTFEMRTHRKDLADRLETLVKAGLWLGGASRAGYGELRCVAFARKDLTLPQDWGDWCRIAAARIGRGHPVPLAPNTPRAPAATWRLEGIVEGPLLIGAISRSADEDRAPWRERQIGWDTGTGNFGPEVWVVPGSALKGPIRHRTRFYLHKQGAADPQAELDDLFGKVASETGGTAGKLRFHDCVLPAAADTIKQTHVGLDRFTGGARRRVLFSDEMLWQPALTIAISELCGPTVVQYLALNAALEDVRHGLCGIGAEWGEGAGIFAAGAKLTVPARPEPEGAADAA